MKTVLTLIFIFSWVGHVHCARDTKNLHAAAMAVAVKSPSISHRHKPKKTTRMRQLQNQQQALAKNGATKKSVAVQVLQSAYETPAQNLSALNQDLCGAAASVTPITQQPTSIDKANQFEFIDRSAAAYVRKGPQKKEFSQKELEDLNGLYLPHWREFYDAYIS